MSISIEHVSKKYQQGKIALSDVEIRVENGLFGLLGPNGAGKTTLLRIMASILSPSNGRVIINGYDLSKSRDRKQVRLHLGYLPQELNLYPHLSGEELLDYFGLLKGMTNAFERHTQTRKLLEALNLVSVARQRISTYSGGMKRRLGIAQALLGYPAVVIVDEPTTGLDPNERIHVRGLFSELARDRIIVLSTHVIEDIEQTCERLAVLRGGRVLFEGETKKITARACGHTWEVKSKEALQFSSRVQVVSSVASGENTVYRVVGELEPSLSVLATPIEPTLEDGYVRLQQL